LQVIAPLAELLTAGRDAGLPANISRKSEHDDFGALTAAALAEPAAAVAATQADADEPPPHADLAHPRREKAIPRTEQVAFDTPPSRRHDATADLTLAWAPLASFSGDTGGLAPVAEAVEIEIGKAVNTNATAPFADVRQGKVIASAPVANVREAETIASAPAAEGEQSKATASAPAAEGEQGKATASARTADGGQGKKIASARAADGGQGKTIASAPAADGEQGKATATNRAATSPGDLEGPTRAGMHRVTSESREDPPAPPAATPRGEERESAGPTRESARVEDPLKTPGEEPVRESRPRDAVPASTRPDDAAPPRGLGARDETGEATERPAARTENRAEAFRPAASEQTRGEATAGKAAASRDSAELLGEHRSFPRTETQSPNRSAGTERAARAAADAERPAPERAAPRATEVRSTPAQTERPLGEHPAPAKTERTAEERPAPAPADRPTGDRSETPPPIERKVVDLSTLLQRAGSRTDDAEVPLATAHPRESNTSHDAAPEANRQGNAPTQATAPSERADASAATTPSTPPESMTAALPKPASIPAPVELEAGVAPAPEAGVPETLTLRLTSAFEALLAAKAREYLEHGATRLRVQLDPPSLGRLRIELDLSDTRASARIFASNPEAAALLSRDRGDLVRAFTQQGIQDVTVHVESENRPPRGGPGDDPTANENFEDWDVAETNVADASPPPAAPRSRLDLFI
jgi:flagellar hook-length control protein FliK